MLATRQGGFPLTSRRKVSDVPSLLTLECDTRRQCHHRLETVWLVWTEDSGMCSSISHLQIFFHKFFKWNDFFVCLFYVQYAFSFFFLFSSLLPPLACITLFSVSLGRSLFCVVYSFFNFTYNWNKSHISCDSSLRLSLPGFMAVLYLRTWKRQRRWAQAWPSRDPDDLRPRSSAFWSSPARGNVTIMTSRGWRAWWVF